MELALCRPAGSSWLTVRQTVLSCCHLNFGSCLTQASCGPLSSSWQRVCPLHKQDDSLFPCRCGCMGRSASQKPQASSATLSAPALLCHEDRRSCCSPSRWAHTCSEGLLLAQDLLSSGSGVHGAVLFSRDEPSLTAFLGDFSSSEDQDSAWQADEDNSDLDGGFQTWYVVLHLQALCTSWHLAQPSPEI